MTAGSDENGSSGSRSAEIKIDASGARDAKTRQRDLLVRLSQATIADAIGLYMRSERHRHYSLADLEWLLLPPLLLNQARLSYVRPQVAKSSKTGGAAETAVVGDLPPMAVGMVTWALISPEVDAKLDTQLKSGMSYRLGPAEWKSGEIARVIDAVGQQDAIKDILTQLTAEIPQLRGMGRQR